jgi:hypothetical protein
MPDEEIRIEIAIDDSGATERIDNLRQRMDTFKGFAKQFAKETGDTLAVAFEGLKQTGLDELEKEIKDIEKQIKRMVEGDADPKAIKSLREQVRLLKKDQSDLRRVAALSLTEAKQEAREYTRVLQNLSKIDIAATNMQLKEQGDTIEDVKEEAEQAQGGVQGLVDRFRDLGAAGTLIAGVFGIGLVQAIREVIELFKEAVKQSLEFQQSLFTLEVAVRGLQRMGLDTTLENWNEILQDLKKQFPIFSRKEFVDAAALAGLMTREFGFTEAQIADLVRQSAILSEITGKDLNEAVRGVTFAIGSGYFESLQRAGVNISRQVVANKALELGYEGVYNELEPVIRASITYAVIQDNLNSIQADAGAIVETTAGQVRRLEARWEDLLIALGNTVTGTEDAKDAISELADSVESLTELVKLLSPEHDNLTTSLIRNVAMYGILQGTVKTFINFVSGEADSILDSLTERFEFLTNWTTQFNENLVQIQKNLGLLPEPILGDFIDEDATDALQTFEVGGVEFSEEDYKKIVEATTELVEEIENIEEESFQRRQDAFEKFRNQVEEDYQNHLDKLADLQEDFNRRIADINLKATQRTEDAIADNAFRVQEANIKASQRREDAERKFREREISAERKFQEKLRQLRENFLLNLEDAVRERDARQIIRLTRQFNLRRKQMIREEGLNKTDRKAQFQEELAQIERQRQERLRQLAVEHQRRLEAIAQQAARERAQAEIEFQRRQEEERLRFEQRKKERNARLKETLDNINESTQERINAVIQGLQDEFDLSDEMLNAISMLYENTYGPDGRIDRAVAYTIARLLQLRQFMNMLQTSLGTVPFTAKDQARFEFDNAGGQAEGGTIIAKKPTVAIFGEAGPEMATFTPLNKLGSQGSKVTPMSASNMPMDGRIRLEMLLSPDLEARVVDNTLGEIADINFAIERAKK